MITKLVMAASATGLKKLSSPTRPVCAKAILH